VFTPGLGRRAVALLLVLTATLFTVRFARADLLVSDNGGDQVFRFNQFTGAPVGGGGGVFIPPGSGGLDAAVGLRLDSGGQLLVASQGNNRILRYNTVTGAFLNEFASNQNTPGANMAGPADIQFGPGGNLYVANFNGSSVDRFSPGGASLGPFTSGGSIAGTASFAFGPDGNLYVGSFGSGTIERYNGVTGVFESNFATGLATPSGLVFNGTDLWFVDLFQHTVNRYSAGGTLLSSFSTGANSFPSHLLFTNDASNNPILLVALTGFGGVAGFTLNGTPTGFFASLGTPGVNIPGQLLLVPDAIPEPVGLPLLLIAASGLVLRRRRV
jgi:hypothetical protein